MGAKPETKLQNKIRKSLEDNGAWVIKIHGSPFTKKGTPDLLICYRGYFIGMEIKTPGNESNTTELQDYQLKEIKKAGGVAVVISSVEKANKVLSFIDRHFENKG